MAWNDRRPYENATVITQQLLDACADNLVFQLESVCDLQTPAGFIRASDRNKYVGGVYYAARMLLPQIKRTIGEWLAPELEFSTITVPISNVDGEYSSLLPGGAGYGGWIGKSVEIKSGLSDITASYKRVFKGYVTEVGGFQRDNKGITVIARDEFDRLNKTFPVDVWDRATFPKLGDNVAGTVAPVIYGDWTVELDPYPAVVPSVVVNGGDPFVDFRDRNVDMTIANPGYCVAANHCLDTNDPIQVDTNGTLPSPLVTGVTYYAVVVNEDVFGIATSPGGPAIAFTGSQSGQHRFRAEPTASRSPVQCAVALVSLLALDSTQVYLKRGDGFYLVPGSEISGLVAGNNRFTVAQKTATLWIDGKEFEYTSGDVFCVRVKGKDLGSYSDNIVWIARDILKTFGGAVDGDFHSNLVTYRDKATPSQSAIASIKARVFETEANPAMKYALSLLEQVRLEAFIDTDRLLKLNAVHFEDWPASPTYSMQTWDIERDRLSPRIDERNVFNRVAGDYNWIPITKANTRQTSVLRNDAAITQMGKEISKKIVFPNLYDNETVKNQAREILRLASSGCEFVELTTTPRAMLQDLGGWVRLNFTVGASVFANVPAMIREISHDQSGVRLSIKVWAMQLVPFPGWSPGYAGIVGGYNATITEE